MKALTPLLVNTGQEYLPNTFNGTWVSDNEIMFMDLYPNMIIRNVESDESRVVVPSTNELVIASVEQMLSADKKFVLFSINYRKLYRHSFSAEYIAFNIETGASIQLTAPDSNDTYLELAVWSPVGNGIAFVHHNNVYYKKSIDADPAVKLTNTGLLGVIYNGVPDWVYEEEIFSSNKALWFSPDGSHLAFGSFNDTRTPVMLMPFYGSVGDPRSQYPRSIQIKYPKAGAPNPTATVFMAKLDGKIEVKPLSMPSDLIEPVLATVSFVNNSAVSVIWANRIQNESQILYCDFEQQDCQEMFTYNEPRGWVEVLHPSVFHSDGSFFFRILPKRIGNDAWRQVAKFSSNGTYEYLTSMKYTVTELLHWDEVGGKLWYTATSEEDSAFQHLYSVTLDGRVDCFTCNVQHSTGSKCLYNEASISKKGTYIVVSCLGPQIPEMYLYNKNGRKLKDLELNTELANQLSDKAVPLVHRFRVQIADGDIPPAQVLILTPPNADLSNRTKYPLLVNVYGGPDSYQVLEKWQIGWGESLVSRWNVVLAMIDGRGSGLKGNNNLFSIYKNLGSYEINDQINVTRHLQKLGYIDPERTCIWGWSYGGYSAALALARGGDTFSCAIAVAPVTDWTLYDSIYTERYMGLPTESDNAKGYKESLLATKENALSIGKKKFLLIHGSLDDNVHYQQSMALSKILQLEDVLFTQMTYPDEDHGLFDVKPHLYHTIEEFLKPNLLKSANCTK